LITIRDVAKLAQVAPSTVSRVIANSPRISPQTATRVREAMEQLGYVPHAAARSLASKTTSTIALTAARSADQVFANPFFAELIRGIGATTASRGYHVLLNMSRDEEEEVEACLRLIREKRVDGLIVTTSRVEDRLIEALDSEEVPFVVIGRCENEDTLTVNNDNVESAYSATLHLLELGHIEIAFIGGDADLVVSNDRIVGYQKALSEYGIKLSEQYVIPGTFSEHSGYESMRQLIENGIRPTAVVAADDVIALGVIQCAKEQGMKLPSDLSVVGFNDDPFGRFIEPQLTTVGTSVFELGRQASILLLDAINNPDEIETRQLILPSRLIARGSTSEGRLKGVFTND